MKTSFLYLELFSKYLSGRIAVAYIYNLQTSYLGESLVSRLKKDADVRCVICKFAT